MAKVFIMHEDRYYMLTEAEYLFVYKELKWLTADQKVTLQIGDYYTDVTADECYWSICGALNRKIDRKIDRKASM